jgi:hypothetical protein
LIPQRRTGYDSTVITTPQRGMLGLAAAGLGGARGPQLGLMRMIVIGPGAVALSEILIRAGTRTL